MSVIEVAWYSLVGLGNKLSRSEFNGCLKLWYSEGLVANYKSYVRPLNFYFPLPTSGLNLLDLIVDMRNEDDDDLNIQCDVFEEEKQCDDDTFASTHSSGIDITNHQDVFNAIFQKVRYFRGC